MNKLLEIIILKLPRVTYGPTIFFSKITCYFFYFLFSSTRNIVLKSFHLAVSLPASINSFIGAV